MRAGIGNRNAITKDELDFKLARFCGRILLTFRNIRAAFANAGATGNDVERSDNPERSRRVLVNTVDAETYEAEFEHKPDHSNLFLRREEYDPANVAGGSSRRFFVDVHGDRLELFIDGYGLKNQVWGLDYQVIPERHWRRRNKVAGPNSIAFYE